MSNGAALGYDGMRRLVDVGRALLAELDPEIVLERVLETAIDLTGARYAAIGVLDQSRTGLEQFITRGLDDTAREAIGGLPRGRGVLGVLIEEPRPLRLDHVGNHPRSYGFPTGHPPMTSFLGVPILVRGEAWGNLYLTDKRDGAFDDADEEATVILAQWAAIAIENARLYQSSEQRRAELEKALRGLEAARDIAIAIGQEARLDRVLELIVKRGRALVDARSVIILLSQGGELVVTARAGHAADAHGARVPTEDSTFGRVMQRRTPERIHDVGNRVGLVPGELGVPGAHSALLVPLVFRDQAVGVLAAFDRGESGGGFTADDEQVLRAFAAGAATAVATARSVNEDRLRHTLAASEAERRRWARELHDETLQALGGLRIVLALALREADPAAKDAAMHEAIGLVEQETENLRAIVSELRPAALDAFGLRAALESLIARHRARGHITIHSELALAGPDDERRLGAELESTVYRLVQEALTNAVKHAQAREVRVSVSEADGEVSLEVRDDGVGFPVDAPTQGFGLAGMRERVHLAGGTLEIRSGPGGTLVRARMAAERDAAAVEAAQDANRPRRSA
jgi:signal transduction histidine kinase